MFGTLDNVIHNIHYYVYDNEYMFKLPSIIIWIQDTLLYRFTHIFDNPWFQYVSRPP